MSSNFYINICALLILASFGIAAETVTQVTANAPKKNHLEELFIWKVSEELKLSTIEEKKFTDTIHDLNAKKQQLTQNLETATSTLIHAKNDVDRKAQFLLFKKILKDYNKLSLDELDRLNAILGIRKLSKYLEVKLDLTNKVKSLMLNPDKADHEKKPLPKPQIIEE